MWSGHEGIALSDGKDDYTLKLRGGHTAVISASLGGDTISVGLSFKPHEYLQPVGASYAP